MRDNRRGKLIENQKEAIKVWEDFLGPNIIEIRWDLFEDFLYFNAEIYLGKHISIIKNTNWDEFFQAFYKMFAKFCISCENFKEIPEIPFSNVDLIFKGKTVTKLDWVSTVEK